MERFESSTFLCFSEYGVSGGARLVQGGFSVCFTGIHESCLMQYTLLFFSRAPRAQLRSRYAVFDPKQS